MSRINKIMVSGAHDKQLRKKLTQSLKNTDTTDANAVIRVFSCRIKFYGYCINKDLPLVLQAGGLL